MAKTSEELVILYSVKIFIRTRKSHLLCDQACNNIDACVVVVVGAILVLTSYSHKRKKTIAFSMKKIYKTTKPTTNVANVASIMFITKALFFKFHFMK